MQKTQQSNNGTRTFILITAFLNLAGIGILNPILPAAVGKYVPNENIAYQAGLLFAAYSLCQFLAVPTLGALSDRYGRRPILLFSLLGSAVGYLVFGLGGALWVLYAGRIIDGVTGGNIAAIYAYSADITQRGERTKFFGLLGSAASLGFVIGPALGGALSLINLNTPLYVAAGVTLLNTIWGYYVMPESLPPEKRLDSISPKKLNPFAQLFDVFKIFQLRWLLIGIFLWTFPFAMLQSNLASLTEVQLFWTPAASSMTLLYVGGINVISQGYFIGRILPRVGEVRLTIIGIVTQGIGLGLMAVVAATLNSPLVFVALFFTAMGNSLINPALNGLLSQAVGSREQGRVQGGNQSIQALARVLGPLWGGWAYVHISPPSPYWTGALMMGMAAFAVFTALPALKAHREANLVIDPEPPSSEAFIKPRFGD